MDEETLRRLENREPRNKPLAPPRRILLTTAFVEHHALPIDGKQTIYWDKKLKGFGLRVGQETRTWIIAYRHNRRMRWHKLGGFPVLGLAAARELAQNRLAQVQLGIDVAQVKQADRDEDTFDSLAQRFLDLHARAKKKPSSIREDERILKHDLLPAWGPRKASDITKKDVIALVDAIAARGAPVSAIRVLALVSTIFNFAIGKDLLSVNPAYRVAKPVIERPRERVLSEAEIKTLWEKLATFESEKIADAYRLMLLTAQREGEVLRMSWNEVDFEGAWWVIPAERSKVHQTHRVPLTATALEILNRRKAAKGKSEHFVFPGLRLGKPLSYIGKRHALIKKACGFDFQPRDLRRTAGTWIASTGVGRFVVARLLGHADRSITGVYDKYSYDSEKRAALMKWDLRLREIIAGKSAKVVALKRHAAA